MIRSSFALLSLVLLLAACGLPPTSPRVGPGFVNGKAIAPTVKMGDPYTVNGEIYVPKYQPNYSEEGQASWYGPGFHGKSTANGERFDSGDLTAAHRTLPMPSMVKVTNLDNGRTAIVRVNDRGPFASNRIIDLSKAAAQKLDMIRTGVAHVRVEYLPAETEQYIAQLGGGKSPQQIAWEERYTDRSQEVEIASNSDSWYSQAAKPSQAISQGTTQAADYSGVTATDLPPPVAATNLPPPKPSPQPPVQAITAPPVANAPISTGNIPAATSSNYQPVDGNRSYSQSPFDAVDNPLDTSQVTVPQPAESPRATPPPTGDPNMAQHGTFVQVGAFGNKMNAEKIAAQYRGARVEGVPPEAPKVYRVRVGPFTDRYSADNMLLQVREKVPDAQLVQQ